MAISNPKWWNDEHTSTWDRVKAAMRRDWEQTKADFTDGGKELNQGVTDTLKQAAGKQDIPPGSVPNPPDLDKEWDDAVEPSYRYGYGARSHYKDEPDWNDRVESKLKEEWNDLKSGRTWDEVKGAVRRGWDKVTK